MKVYIISSARMEELYVEDWINHHLSLGVDKIIINDNNDENYPYKLKDAIDKKYIDSGKVIVEDFSKSNEYVKIDDPNYFGNDENLSYIYSWLYNKYKNEFDWCVKLDIDEYLEIPETNNDIKKFLSLDKFKNYDTIAISWVQKTISKNLPNEAKEYYFPISVQERCKTLDFRVHYWFKGIARSLNKKINFNFHLPTSDSIPLEKTCLVNGISVREAIDKKFCDIRNDIEECFYVNFNNTMKLSKYAYLNHYRFRSNEEIYFFRLVKFDRTKYYDDKIPTRDLYKIYIKSKCK